MKQIAIVGASGFVGTALIDEILSQTSYRIVALSRSDRSKNSTERVEWRQCDLYSLLDIEKALEGCDSAIYLVHSMLPSAQLVQGSFADYDLLLSDNFSRAARKLKLIHTVYLGGIIPENVNLSDHLQSRLEVENNLKASGVPTTSLRAGVIIGKDGSSYRMMENLVRRLPVMLCPRWTATKSSPVDIRDVVRAIVYCVQNKNTYGQTYDLGSTDAISYKEMMQGLAKYMGLKRIFIPVLLFSPGLSKLWVRLITGAPKDLVYPLVSSLAYSMLPRQDHVLQIPNHRYLSFSESIQSLETNKQQSKQPHAYAYSGKISNHDVQSVQRITPRQKMSAQQIAQSYFWWLPRFFRPLIQISQADENYEFRVLSLGPPILSLKFSESRSTPDRMLYYVVGGLLARKEGRGRLEFREILVGNITLAAIHDFRPSLPWYIYKYTQALIHLFTMNSFKRFLNKTKTMIELP